MEDLIRASEPIINLQNEVIALGPYRRDLVTLYLRWYNDFEASASYLLQLRPRSLETQDEMAARIVKGGPHSIDFTIYERATLQPIGLTNLDNIDPVNRRADYNIFIGEKACWGKGYGTATTRLMCDYGFTLLGLHNILLTVDSDNTRAIRAYTRAGFQMMGRRRQARWRGTHMVDVIYMDYVTTDFEHSVLQHLLPQRAP